MVILLSGRRRGDRRRRLVGNAFLTGLYRPEPMINKIIMIFGRKVTKHYKGKLQTVIEDLELPNPVIRSHYGNGFLKHYIRDRLCLRTEPTTNDVTDYGVKKAVENLPQLRDKLTSICDNYLSVQQDILETFVD